MGLIFDILPYYVGGDSVTYTPNKVSIAPKLPCPQLFPQFRKLLEYLTGRHTLQYLHCLCRGISGRYFNKYVNMVFHYFHHIYPKSKFFGYPSNHADAIQKFDHFVQSPLPRLSASRFHPPSLPQADGVFSGEFYKYDVTQ